AGQRPVTGSLAAVKGPKHARFRVWDATTAKPGMRQETTRGGEASLYWPLALAPVWSRSGKEVEYIAAVCVLDHDANGKVQRAYRLCLFDPAANKVVHEYTLWEGGPVDRRVIIHPVLAVGPRGGHLAVAGSPGHAVQVYALDDLIGRKPQPKRQELRSIGSAIRHIAWVTKQGVSGLLLRQSYTTID